MKKIFMLFVLMALVGTVSVDAQTCSKSKEACTTAAVKAANTNVDIEKRICEQSGKVSFVRKSVCDVSGKTSYTDVEYNMDTKKFVNVSPTHASGKAAKAKASCGTAKKAGCCAAGKAKATSASTTAKKACCSKGAAASCSKKTTSAVKKTTSAKAVKISNE